MKAISTWPITEFSKGDGRGGRGNYVWSCIHCLYVTWRTGYYRLLASRRLVNQPNRESLTHLEDVILPFVLGCRRGGGELLFQRWLGRKLFEALCKPELSSILGGEMILPSHVTLLNGIKHLPPSQIISPLHHHTLTPKQTSHSALRVCVREKTCSPKVLFPLSNYRSPSVSSEVLKASLGSGRPPFSDFLHLFSRYCNSVLAAPLSTNQTCNALIYVSWSEDHQQ